MGYRSDLPPEVLLALAPGFEEIEAITVIDILRRAKIKVIVAGLEKGLIEGAHGIRVQPDRYIEDVFLNPAHDTFFHMMVLPGGMPGTENLKKSETVIRAVRNHDYFRCYLAAICAAPTVLAEAGVLKGRRATSYPGFADQMPGVEYQTEPVVVDERFITSRGPATAIDFALTLVEVLKGKEVRDQVARDILKET